MERFFILFWLFILGLSCGNASSEEEDPSVRQFEAFLDFYDRFHADSLYQMAHIRFPLEGLPSNADSATLASGNFHWREEDWVLMKEFDTESDFERSFTPLTDRLIVEQMLHRSGRYGLQRRWARQGEDWYLIYYSGLNAVQVE